MVETDNLLKTPLFDLHTALGGRMVGFGGYALPVQYKGIVAEHLHTRQSASLFDVSHMGQVTVTGPDHATTAAALETILPGELLSLKPGEMRYTVLLNDKGGIEDDLIVTRPAEGQAPDGILFIVVNAATKHNDMKLMQAALGDTLNFALHDDRALIAIQGPKAVDALARHSDITQKLTFMQAGPATIAGFYCHVSRAGYTGEDGFEISVANAHAKQIAELLLAEPELEPAGLGARDSLRLEAGLCLYGHDMNADIDPVTAGIFFAIGKRRRTEGGFPGADTVLKVLEDGPAMRRVGIRFDGRLPVREGAELVDADGKPYGHVTSGGFSPSLEAPIAMAYLPASVAALGNPVTAMVRGKPVTGTITKMPFVPQRYVRTLS